MEKETSRKLIHISMGLWTIPLAFLGRELGLVIIVLAFIFVVVIARPSVWNKAFEAMASREEERKAGLLKGPTLYVIMVFFLVLLFDLRIAAAMFGVMAFGDGFANIIGSRYGRIRFERFQNKSLEGFLAFVFFSFIGAITIFLLMSINPSPASIISILRIKEPVEISAMIITSGLVAVISALVELTTSKYINDNVSVPAIGAIVFTLFLQIL